MKTKHHIFDYIQIYINLTIGAVSISTQNKKIFTEIIRIYPHKITVNYINWCDNIS